jgi:Flp pilus assembly protein TadD
LGLLYLHEGRADRSVAECERALAIDPNFAAAHAWIGFAKYLAGRNDETEAHVLEALRISPRDIYAGNWMIIAACAKMGAGRDEEAVVWYNRSIGLNPNRPITHFALAAALARLGQKERARSGPRGAQARSGLHHRAVPIDDVQRPSRVSRRPRTHVRGHAHGGGAGGVIRKIAAILVADAGDGSPAPTKSEGSRLRGLGRRSSMPIRPQCKWFYPIDWPQLSAVIRFEGARPVPGVRQAAWP